MKTRLQIVTNPRSTENLRTVKIPKRNYLDFVLKCICILIFKGIKELNEGFQREMYFLLTQNDF